MSKPLYVVGVIVDNQSYVFLYDVVSIPQVMQHLGKLAADPDEAFTWEHAAIASKKIRQMQPPEAHGYGSDGETN